MLELIAAALSRPMAVWASNEKHLSEAADGRSWCQVNRSIESFQSPQAAPFSLLELANQSPRAVSQLNASGQAIVARRLSKHGDAVVTVCAEAGEADLVEQLLESLASQHRTTTDRVELEEENNTFAMQLASDLEELSFLRSMVERLSASRLDDELLGMAESTLPVLNATVRARCLAFMSLPNVKDPYTPQVAAVNGTHPIEHATLCELVRRFGPSASKQTLVKNWGDDPLPGREATREDDRIDGVNSLVLAPMVSGNKHFGWLLAINRVPSAEIGLESSWQLASGEFGSGEGSLIATTASILATHAANIDLLREKEQLLVSMVRTLVSAIESKDNYTRGHSERVALYTKRIAEQLNYEVEEAENLYLSGLLHDVGKIGVSDAVLKKDGRLTPEEYAEIAKHPDEGWAILYDIDQLRYVLPGVLHHHERWDGQGYPDGLAGESIPLDARVMAVADAYDAMTSDRPYRSGMPCEKAESILREGAGTQWDPQCIEAFFACLDDIHRIRDNYQRRERPIRQVESPRDETLSLPHELVGVKG